MAVSKRTRYEVLRRDNHTCRYCGATASETKITVDHVLPVALGALHRGGPAAPLTFAQPTRAARPARSFPCRYSGHSARNTEEGL